MKNITETAYRLLWLASILLLACGFALVRIWWGTGCSILFALVSLLTRRFLPEWTSTLRLVGYIGIAVAGTLTGVSSFLMIVGCALALACWELEDRPSGWSAPVAGSDEWVRLRWLGIACSAGIAIAGACFFIRISLTFGMILIVALTVLFSLVKLMALFKKMRSVH